MNGVRRAAGPLIGLLLAASVQASCGRGPEPTTQPSPTIAGSAAPTEGTPTPIATPARTTAAPTPTPARTTPAPSRTTPKPPFPPSLAGKDVERIPTTRKVVALTFDAGANADGVSAILATLAREHITASFFLTGSFVQQYPQSARSIADAGHRLGNHSVSHPHFPSLTDAQMRAQLTGAEASIKAVTGRGATPLFRFPYGDTTAHAISVVNAQGYVAVRWTVDSLGWQGTSGGRSVGSVTQRVLAAAVPGEIALMHVGSHPTDHSTLDADALPGIIAGLRERGYTFVTLDALSTA